ncbi:GTE8, partial [Symbiodinium microadriaticum]
MEESKSSSLLVNVSHAKSQSPTAVQQTQDTSMWPSLRGKLGIENGTSVCRGQWGMNDAAHNIPGQTSGFEFSLVKPEGDPSSFPVDGKYAGWFMIKQTPKSSLKVEDKDLNIKFVKDEKEDAYKITGNGVNKFGAFNLAGSLQMADNSIHMFRIYTPKKLPVGTTPRTGATQRTGSRPIPAAVPPSPRESSSRVRRPSIVLQEAVDGGLPASLDKKHADKKHADKKPTPAVAVPVAPKQRLSSETVTAGRTPRPPAFVAKCREITRELSKQHLSIYFNEPVDTVKLGIPDYRDIVKEPMDFGTVAKNLESGLYSSHEEFAEHMRLVFKNAITYNVRRDNPVHIAAREMSDMFEERYRVMVSQLGAYAATAEMDMGLLRGAPKKGKGASAGRAGRGGGRLSSGGPRVDGGVPALDSSMQTMLMMQQKMQQMEAEINSLRTAVRQSDIRATLGQQAVAAQAPLSYEEKKVLISNIMKLDGEQMTGVVDIIQSAMPSAACGDGDEVEIPVDELDTYTLRTLQEYVQ